MKLSKQTDLQCYWYFRWRMGTHVMVFLHNYKTIKEVFNKTEVADRPNWWFFNVGENPSLGECVSRLVYTLLVEDVFIIVHAVKHHSSAVFGV